MGLCKSTLWQRKNFYHQVEFVEDNLKDTLHQFSKSYSTLVGDDIKFDKDSKLDHTTFSFRRVNLPKLQEDNGEEIVTKEIEKMVDSAEKMIKSAEDGDFVKAGIIFIKQVVSSAKVVFNSKPGESTETTDPQIRWLMAQSLLQVS